MAEIETLDITVRIVIPRNLIIDGFTDEEVVVDVFQQIVKEYSHEGVQVHLAEVSDGLIV